MSDERVSLVERIAVARAAHEELKRAKPEELGDFFLHSHDSHVKELERELAALDDPAGAAAGERVYLKEQLRVAHEILERRRQNAEGSQLTSEFVEAFSRHIVELQAKLAVLDENAD